MRSLVNGNPAETVSTQDRGFQYGDGLFETLALDNGEVKNWALHWARLSHGCERLFLPLPDESLLLSEINRVSVGVGKEIVKIIISRGEGVKGSRGYAFDEVYPTRVVSAYQWPELPAKNHRDGINLFVCQTRISIQPLLAGIKHLNRLENVLARHEWNSLSAEGSLYAEGIMLDMEGNVVEGTMSNLFIVKNNVLQTPDLSKSGVAGITRERIMSVANEKGIALEVKNIKLQHVEQADEVFVCNTVIGIWPVKTINGKRLSAKQLSSKQLSSAQLNDKEVDETKFQSEELNNPVTQSIQKAIA